MVASGIYAQDGGLLLPSSAGPRTVFRTSLPIRHLMLGLGQEDSHYLALDQTHLDEAARLVRSGDRLIPWLPDWYFSWETLLDLGAGNAIDRAMSFSFRMGGSKVGEAVFCMDPSAGAEVWNEVLRLAAAAGRTLEPAEAPPGDRMWMALWLWPALVEGAEIPVQDFVEAARLLAWAAATALPY